MQHNRIKTLFQVLGVIKMQTDAPFTPAIGWSIAFVIFSIGVWVISRAISPFVLGW